MSRNASSGGQVVGRKPLLEASLAGGSFPACRTCGVTRYYFSLHEGEFIASCLACESRVGFLSKEQVVDYATRVTKVLRDREKELAELGKTAKLPLKVERSDEDLVRSTPGREFTIRFLADEVDLPSVERVNEAVKIGRLIDMLWKSDMSSLDDIVNEVKARRGQACA